MNTRNSFVFSKIFPELFFIFYSINFGNVYKLCIFPGIMEKIAIIASSKDAAGINVRNNLIESIEFEKIDERFEDNEIYEFNKISDKLIKLYLTNNDLIHSENIDQAIDADIFIFASKHRSKENTKSFAVHSIGNWGGAELGGKEGQLCHSSAVLLKNLFITLNKNAKVTGYEMTMEATHHGPYVFKPSVFVEVGSTEEEWKNKENGRILAKTIIEGISDKNFNYKIAIGIGGPHYCNNFNKIMLESDIAFSFICPKYALPNLNEDVINQAIAKTKEKVDFAVLDWKGLGQEKERVMGLLGNSNLEFIRSDKI